MPSEHEEDRRNVERVRAENKRDNALCEAVTLQERSTIWNALSIAARTFEEDIANLRKVADELRAGGEVTMFARGESGARAADRLIAQFEQQLKDTRALIERFE